MISIAALIYRSTAYADALWDSLHRHTPMLRNGGAEFYFVANDASDAVLEHLKDKHYPHVVQENPRRTEAELEAMGIGKPEYLHRTYRGWNRAIREARGEHVVLINSDMLVSPCWLENLYKWKDCGCIVASRLIERKHPKYDVFPGAIHGEHGTHPREFDEAGFLAHCAEVSQDGARGGGAYMPSLFRREWFDDLGMFPEGNLHAGSFGKILEYGDESLFKRFARAGIGHITALDSLVYHFKEGEQDE